MFISQFIQPFQINGRALCFQFSRAANYAAITILYLFHWFGSFVFVFLINVFRLLSRKALSFTFLPAVYEYLFLMFLPAVGIRVHFTFCHYYYFFTSRLLKVSKVSQRWVTGTWTFSFSQVFPGHAHSLGDVCSLSDFQEYF